MPESRLGTGLCLALVLLAAPSTRADAVIGPPQVNGSGCPEGSFEVETRESSVRVALRADRVSPERPLASCALAVPIVLSEGRRISIVGFLVSGQRNLGSAALLRLTRSLFFTGQPASTRTIEYGPGGGAVVVAEAETGAPAIVALPGCHTQAIARANTSLLLRGSGEAALESFILELKLEPC